MSAPSDEIDHRPLLIIEGDPATLHKDGLLCADRLATAARMFGVEPVVVLGTSTAALTRQLADASVGAVYDTVIIVAHGNSQGVALVPGELVPWTVLASDWLRPLEPEIVAFISCKAARMYGVSAMFDAIDCLEEVFASPLNMSLLQSRAIDFLVPRFLDPGIAEGWVHAVQIGQLLLGRGLLFRYTRTGWVEGDEVSDILQTLAEELVVPPIADALFRGLDDLLGRRGGGNDHFPARAA